MNNDYTLFQPITLYQFFPKNKRLRLSKQGNELINNNNDTNNPLRSDSFFNNSKNRIASKQNNRTLSTNRTNHNSFNSINQQYINSYQTNNNFYKHKNQNTKNSYNTIIMDNRLLDKQLSLNSYLFSKYIDFNGKIKRILPLDNKNYNSNLPNLYMKKKNKTKEKNNMNVFTTLYSNNNNYDNIYSNNILNSLAQSKKYLIKKKK